jgi:hypothetical protein
MVSGDRGGGSGVLGAAERAQRKVAKEGGNGCCWVVFNRMGGRKGGLGARSRKGEGGPVGAQARWHRVAWQGHARGEGSSTGS